MTPNEYQIAASRTMPNKDPLKAGLHGVLGLQDEICEFLSAAETLEETEAHREETYIWEQWQHANEIHVHKELGDIWWMAAEIATANDLLLENLFADETCVDTLAYSRVAQKLAGVYQKHFQGHPIDRDKVKTMLSMFVKNLKIVTLGYAPLEKIWEMNIKKLQARYPEGFDPERSLHRKPEDI